MTEQHDLAITSAQREVRPHLPTTAAEQLASPSAEWLDLDLDSFASSAIPIGLTLELLREAAALPPVVKKAVAEHIRLLLATLAIGEREREEAPPPPFTQQA